MKWLKKYSYIWFIVQGVILILFELDLEYELYATGDNPPRLILAFGLGLCLLGYLCLYKSKAIKVFAEIILCLYCIFALCFVYWIIGVGSPKYFWAILMIIMSVFNLVSGFVILFSLLTQSYDK